MNSDHNISIFDAIANSYDEDFSNTISGLHQRKQVHEQLKIVLKTSPKNILEINCGTGIDAIMMSSYGHNVIATDVSSNMINVAKQKNSNLQNVTFVQSSFSELKTKFNNQKFELIFSNFGGLNCLKPTDLKKIFDDLHQILLPNGKFIIVVMPEAYIWDWLYFSFKVDFKSAIRRRKVASISLNGNIQETWYYNVNKIKALSIGKFMVHSAKPIGQLIPPTHLEKKLKFAFPFLAKLESLLKYILPADLSDHTYIELERIA
jgi:ubiquinone/menaquinone biosynthesis C-methylase UbiE